MPLRFVGREAQGRIICGFERVIFSGGIALFSFLRKRLSPKFEATVKAVDV